MMAFKRGTQTLSSLPVFVLALLLSGVVQVQAAPPEFSEIQSLIFMDFEHAATPFIHGDNYAGGIWAFDPTTLKGRRIRDFDITSYLNQDDAYFGQDLQLETENGLLVIQTWPTELRFDPLSRRLIGRWPTTPSENLVSTEYSHDDLEPEVGWTLQGPILSESKVSGTGLRAGVFGVPRCIHYWLTERWDWSYPPIDCMGFDPYQGGDPVEWEGPLLMWSPSSPPNAYDAEIVTALPPSDCSHGLSWDPERKGFWLGLNEPDTASEGVGFLPVRDGEVFPADSLLNLDLELDSNRFLDLDLVFYAPDCRKILGWGRMRNRDQPADALPLTFLADPETGQTTRNPFAEWTPKFPIIDPYAGTVTLVDAKPVSATSFRDKPRTLQQLIPIIADVDGRHGTHWRTDVSFFNPSDEEMRVEIRRLSNDATKLFVLPPHASRAIPSVLSWVGGGENGDGLRHDALYVASPWHFGDQLRIDGRIWTRDPTTGGLFGHALEAVPAPFGYSNHPQYAQSFGLELWGVQATLQLIDASLQLDERIPGRFRYNVGVTNPYDEELQIVLLWGYQSSRPFLYLRSFPDYYPESARVMIKIPPKSLKIFDVLSLFPEDLRSTWPARVAVIGNRAAPVWFSMIDEKTQDATFVPYTNFQAPALQWDEEADRQVDPMLFYFDQTHRKAIPAIAHSPGVGDTEWKTTLYGYQGPDPLRQGDFAIGAFYDEQGVGGCSQGSLQVLHGVMPSNEDLWSDYYNHVLVEHGLNDYSESDIGFRNVFPDVIHSIHGCEEAEDVRGALEIVSGSWCAGFSRTFTTRDDGGTYGSMLPLYPPAGWPIQHFAGLEISEESRINIGFFNGDHEHAIRHQLSLYDTAGALVARREFILDSLNSRQSEIHNLFSGVELPEGVYGLTVLPLDGIDTEGTAYQGHSWAYVSIIDKLTNDPINLW